MLAEIVERDGYRCGLCCTLVTMSKVIPHPKAPTIDHIVPLSAGGDDTKANVQLACFLCNSIKGNRGSQQLKLIG
jgi:5-methylcytosine-specific restriction endonuclease McrA